MLGRLRSEATRLNYTIDQVPTEVAAMTNPSDQGLLDTATSQDERNPAEDIGVGNFIPLCFRDRKDSLYNFMFSYLEEHMVKQPSKDVLYG